MEWWGQCYPTLPRMLLRSDFEEDYTIIDSDISKLRSKAIWLADVLSFLTVMVLVAFIGFVVGYAWRNNQ